MLIIILKIILCSALCIAVYFLFLEKEKMYRFNRFYLLFSLLFSYVVPFISIAVQVPEIENRPGIVFEDTIQQIAITKTQQESFGWMPVIWIVYGLVSLFFLVRSLRSARAIRKLSGKRLIYQNYRVMVTDQNLSPFSFWNTIYLGKEYIKNNTIDPRIFLHEKSHINQKHSIDLILLDIMMIFTWFNPILFFYKKAVTTNHEFLADETVLKSRYDIKEYQNLILDEIISSQNISLTHSFNFNNTKKRFIMMTVKKTKFIFLKKAAGIAAIITATSLFAERTYTVNSPISEGNQKSSKATDGPFIQNVKNFHSSPTKEATPDYFEKTGNKKPSSIEIKKEIAKATPQDTISPKTASNEGKNTNVNIQQDEDYVQAQFPEGEKSLRSKVGSTLDTSIFSGKEKLIKSTAYIHIDEGGKVSQITASGDNEIFNKEIIRTMTAVNNGVTWKPATKNGKAIASVYKLPATMSFQ
ncbi:M56 family metallopeptidase [Chryseobacterium oranimense]|uniref:M56 family metallopeptidase n=1 Tax=Chryseobacterium oranimense TaxID=421058 RepID=UPI0031DE7014